MSATSRHNRRRAKQGQPKVRTLAVVRTERVGRVPTHMIYRQTALFRNAGKEYL